MALHQRLGADVIRQLDMRGLRAYRPTFGAEGLRTPAGWFGFALLMPIGVDAEPPDRQSHERGLYP